MLFYVSIIIIPPSSICSIWHTLNVTKLHCDIVTLPREQSGACFNSCDFEHLRKKMASNRWPEFGGA